MAENKHAKKNGWYRFAQYDWLNHDFDLLGEWEWDEIGKFVGLIHLTFHLPDSLDAPPSRRMIEEGWPSPLYWTHRFRKATS